MKASKLFEGWQEPGWDTRLAMLIFLVLICIGLFTRCTRGEQPCDYYDAYRAGWISGKEASIPYCGQGDCLQFIVDSDSIMALDAERWNANNQKQWPSTAK